MIRTRPASVPGPKKTKVTWRPALPLLACALALACNRDPGISFADPLPPGYAPPPSEPGPTPAQQRDAGFTFAPPDAGALPPVPTNGCPSRPGDDNDQDGYTVAQGDCNDCDKLVNPGAYDVPGNMVDEDCSGKADDEAAACDTALAVEGDGFAAAKAIGLCRVAKPAAQGKDRTWGVVKASYVFPDGSPAALSSVRNVCGKLGDPPNPLSHGILPLFGSAVKPRQGASLLALSSGIARAGRNVIQAGRPSPDGAEMCTRSRTPAGFPVSDYSTCGDIEVMPGENTANDSIALELVIRVPTNAASLSFDFDFYTFEYDQYVCSFFNDAFVALLYSKIPDLPANHNIAFDSQGNPVSVNNGFVEVCRPFTYQGTKMMVPFTRDFPCKLGIRELTGTGFENKAATGWLQTHSNVVPGEEITLRFAIWDAGDELLDSTVLLDNFKWDAKPGSTVTIRPPPIE
jgi:putative metal-binding protein